VALTAFIRTAPAHDVTYPLLNDRGACCGGDRCEKVVMLGVCAKATCPFPRPDSRRECAGVADQAAMPKA